MSPKTETTENSRVWQADCAFDELEPAALLPGCHNPALCAKLCEWSTHWISAVITSARSSCLGAKPAQAYTTALQKVPWTQIISEIWEGFPEEQTKELELQKKWELSR